MGTDQSDGEVFGRLCLKQAGGQNLFMFAGFNRLHQRGDQAFLILFTDRLRRRYRDPFGIDARAAQHHLDPAAARIGHDEHGGALFARAAGAA